MTTHKIKKVVKQRAKTTHGYGSMKKNRGAGNRGGRGRAGTGKRGDAKKPSCWKDKKFFGKYGFKRKNSVKTKSITLKQIDDNADSWTAKGIMENLSGTYKIDLAKLGYNKLLGTGQAKKKLEVNVQSATEKAVEKIKKAGGKITVLNIRNEEPPSKE